MTSPIHPRRNPDIIIKPIFLTPSKSEKKKQDETRTIKTIEIKEAELSLSTPLFKSYRLSLAKINWKALSPARPTKTDITTLVAK